MARPKLERPNYQLVRRGTRIYIQWWENGGWKRVSTGSGDERQAQIFLAQFIAGRETPAAPKAPTVAEVMAGYLEDRRPVVRAFNTLEVSAKVLVRHLGDLQAAHLTKERIRFYHAKRRTRGIGSAPQRRAGRSRQVTAPSSENW
jgi:hypothetical protein